MNRNLTILIAEDNEDDIRLLERALRANKINNPIQFCLDGEQTLDYLRGKGAYADRAKFPTPSVLFLDLKMPRRSGFEVLKWIKEHPECAVIPVIVLSSSQQSADIERAYQLGANSYMVKPTTYADLVEMIASAYQYWCWCAKPELPRVCNEEAALVNR